MAIDPQGSSAAGGAGRGPMRDILAVLAAGAIHVLAVAGGRQLPDRPVAVAPPAGLEIEIEMLPAGPRDAEPPTEPAREPPPAVPAGELPPRPIDPVTPTPAAPPAAAPEPDPTVEPSDAVEPPALEPPTAEPPALEPPALEPPALEPPTAEPPTTELPTAEPPAPAAPQPIAEAPPAAPVAEAPTASPGPVAEAPQGAPDAASLPAPGAADEYGGPPAADGAAIPGLPGPSSLVPGMPGPAPLWTLPGVVSSARSAPAPTRAPAARVDALAATRALGGTLQTQDKERGVNLPAAGAVATAVSTAVQGTAAPHNARATFEIRLGADGKVLGARVVKASAGDPAQWQAALDRAKAQLAAQGLAMTGAAAKSGATVRVSVTTKHLFPTGTGRKLEMKPVCANGALNELAVAARKKSDDPVTDPNAVPDAVSGANPFVDANGMPCIPVGISGTMDASNIGAHRQLVVQTKFDVEMAGAVALPTDIKPVNTDAPWANVGKEGPRPTLPYKARKREQKREKKK